MKTFELTCLRMYSLYLVFLGIPIVMMAFMGFIMVTFKDLPDWAIIVIIVLIIGYMIVLAFYVLKKISRIPCLVHLDEVGIKIELLKWSIFFPGKVFQSGWAQIREASSSYEPQRQNRFYKVSFSQPYFSIYLDNKEKLEDPNEETEFGALLMGYVAKYNEKQPNEPTKRIDTRNFYQAPWAKNVTRLVWVILVGFMVVKVIYPDSIEYWRMFQFTFAAAIWLMAYHINNRKKKT